MLHWIVKLFCALGAVTVAAVLGFVESWRLKLRVRQLEDGIRFLQGTESEIQYAAYPIDQILARHREDWLLLDDCCRLIETGMKFHPAWKQAVAQGRGGSGLSREDKTYLLEFGSTFGSMDQAGQMASCRLTLTRLEQQLAQARQDVARKAKLYGSLGLLCGAGILCVVV